MHTLVEHTHFQYSYEIFIEYKNKMPQIGHIIVDVAPILGFPAEIKCKRQDIAMACEVPILGFPAEKQIRIIQELTNLSGFAENIIG